MSKRTAIAISSNVARHNGEINKSSVENLVKKALVKVSIKHHLSLISDKILRAVAA